ncbi:MAG: hypothetical protein IJV91_01680, partial [Kiritimatiellae bacterium]|nr:hypothetical protein [Kiritimatiellia bacterium]
MPNPPKKIIPNANDSDSFNELKHRQNCHLIRTGAFTLAMVHLVSRTTLFVMTGIEIFLLSAFAAYNVVRRNQIFTISF